MSSIREWENQLDDLISQTNSNMHPPNVSIPVSNNSDDLSSEGDHFNPGLDALRAKFQTDQSFKAMQARRLWDTIEPCHDALDQQEKQLNARETVRKVNEMRICMESKISCNQRMVERELADFRTDLCVMTRDTQSLAQKIQSMSSDKEDGRKAADLAKGPKLDFEVERQRQSLTELERQLIKMNVWREHIETTVKNLQASFTNSTNLDIKTGNLEAQLHQLQSKIDLQSQQSSSIDSLETRIQTLEGQVKEQEQDGRLMELNIQNQWAELQQKSQLKFQALEQQFEEERHCRKKLERIVMLFSSAAVAKEDQDRLATFPISRNDYDQPLITSEEQEQEQTSIINLDDDEQMTELENRDIF